jgi:O-acetyl-ADP-ribose deacetylase (regulator of RNase III)
VPKPYPKEFREDVVRVARSRDSKTTIAAVAGAGERGAAPRCGVPVAGQPAGKTMYPLVRELAADGVAVRVTCRVLPSPTAASSADFRSPGRPSASPPSAEPRREGGIPSRRIPANPRLAISRYGSTRSTRESRGDSCSSSTTTSPTSRCRPSSATTTSTGGCTPVVASAIRAAAGQQVEDLSIDHGRASLGEAWFTHAGRLSRLKGIIHVAAVNRRGKTKISVIRKCVKAALDKAVEQGCESVALATFGVERATADREVITPETWFNEVVPVIVKYLNKLPRSTRLAVLLVLFEPEDLDKSVKQVRHACTLDVSSETKDDAPS